MLYVNTFVGFSNTELNKSIFIKGGKKLKKSVMLILCTIGFVLCFTGVASAHFTMVFPGGDTDVTPKDYIAEKGETKEIVLVWGHPYEHIMFDFPGDEPVVNVTKPDGSVVELSPEKTTVKEKKAYQVSYTVDQRGDHILSVKLETEEHGLVDYTKAVIHSGTEAWKGWDTETGQKTEIMPYMRPYGMEEGFVFSGKALYNKEPLPNATVEVEEYHKESTAKEIVKSAEDKYSNDPPMVFTRVAKTNENGDFMYTLDETGIWFVGATKEIEDGLDKRGVFILPVIEEFPAENTSTPSDSATEQSTTDKDSSSNEQETTSLPGFGFLIAAAGIIGAVAIGTGRIKKN